MARLVIPTELLQFEQKMENLGNKAENVAKGAVYEGMRVLADAYKQNIGALRVDNTKFVAGNRKVNVIDAETKAAMQEHVGVSRIEKEGRGYKASVSVTRYGPVKTKKYPGGQPLPMIGRSVEGGSPYRLAQSFALKTIDSTKAQAIEAMKTYFLDTVRKMTE